MGIWNCFTCSNPENEELKNTRVEMLEAEQMEALDLIWDKTIFIGTRECRVRDLVTRESSEHAARRPVRKWKKAQAKYMRMLQRGMVDYDDEEYLQRRFSKLSAFQVHPEEMQRRIGFWFTNWSDASAELRVTEEHLAALDQEIQVVEHQKTEIEQARSRRSALSKRKKCYKLRAFFKRRQQ